jgi:hypothetical protein
MGQATDCGDGCSSRWSMPDSPSASGAVSRSPPASRGTSAMMTTTDPATRGPSTGAATGGHRIGYASLGTGERWLAVARATGSESLPSPPWPRASCASDKSSSRLDFRSSNKKTVSISHVSSARGISLCAGGSGEIRPISALAGTRSRSRFGNASGSAGRRFAPAKAATSSGGTRDLDAQLAEASSANDSLLIRVANFSTSRRVSFSWVRFSSRSSTASFSPSDFAMRRSPS